MTNFIFILVDYITKPTKIVLIFSVVKHMRTFLQLHAEANLFVYLSTLLLALEPTIPHPAITHVWPTEMSRLGRQIGLTSLVVRAGVDSFNKAISFSGTLSRPKLAAAKGGRRLMYLEKICG